MDNKNEDDGLYDLIDVDDSFGDGSDTCRTENLLFNTNSIDWNRMQVDVNSGSFIKKNLTNIKENQNKVPEALKLVNNNCCSNDLEVSQGKNVLSARSKMVNKRAEDNMDIYLPLNMKRNICNGGAKIDYYSCRECGERSTSGVGWCLFCGVLLIEAQKKEQLDNCINETDNCEIITKTTDLAILSNGSVKWRHMDVEEIDDKGRQRIETRTIKLDLGGLDTRRSTNMDDWDFDFGIGDNIQSLSNNASHNIVVPPLDLSSLDSSRQIPIKPQLNNPSIGEFKENCDKPLRKWATSSTAWVDIPNSVLQKKPSNYYRNKLNSCTNKIGITVHSSSIEDDNDDVHRNSKILNGNSVDENIIPDRSSMVKKGFQCVESIIEPDCSPLIKKKIQCVELTNISDAPPIIKNGFHVTDFISIPDRPPIVIGCINQNDKSVSQWQCLPAEIWIQIMSYLSHYQLSLLQLSCRRLYYIGTDPSLWRIINLYRHGTLSNEHIVYIAKKAPKELHFKNCFGTNITYSGLVQMFKTCGDGLKKISFISCSKGAFEDDLFLELSAIFCPNVTHINASYLMNFRDDTLGKMIVGFSKIESLNIMGAHAISNKSIKSLIEHHRASLINLDLYGCFKLNSSTLVLIEECINLQSLALGSISNLKRTVLIDMLKKLSQLSILDLRGTMNLVDDSLLDKICQSCPNLQQIILTNSCRLTDQGVIGLAKSCVSKSLKILDICGCSKITEKGLEEVLKECRELEDLDISCTSIKGDGAKFFKMYAPPKLRCLRINNNKFISTEELLSLIRSCKKLCTIYMCGTTSIGAWRPIQDQFPHITFKHE